MKIVTSWDDGHKLDLRLANLLKRYDLPAIFYVPNDCSKIKNYDCLSEDDIILLKRQGFVIGGHTLHHPEDMKTLSDEELKNEIEGNKEWIEKVIGEKIKHFCPPKGRYNDRVLEFVKRAGYETSRTVLVKNTNLPVDLYRIKPTIHIYPNRVEYNNFDLFRMATNLFQEAKAKGDKGYYHIWGHSWEIEKYNLWKVLEKLFKYIKTYE